MTVTDYQTGVDFTIGRCAQQLQANPIRLNAPLYADPATVESMRNDSVISKALRAGTDSDIMVFGVGAVSTATTLFAGSFVDSTMLDELESRGAVGEIGAVSTRSTELQWRGHCPSARSPYRSKQ